MKVETIPTVDLSENDGFNREVLSALKNPGAFQLRAPNLMFLQKMIIERAEELFSLSQTEKEQYQIDRKSSYSGYSMLATERDFREQFHLFYGFEEENTMQADPCIHLKAPNKVPDALPPDWSESVSEYFSEMVKLAGAILKPVEEVLLMPGSFKVSGGGSSYSLIKMINYLPVSNQKSKRLGTPPHVDWSWLTIVMQDENPGLSLKMPGGNWLDFTLSNQCFLVLTGELLELASRGQFQAPPHKVVMREGVNSRISAPFFYSPDLNSTVKIAADSFVESPERVVDEHIHRLFNLEEVEGDFHFGVSEIMRKQYKRWCEKMDCCT